MSTRHPSRPRSLIRSSRAPLRLYGPRVMLRSLVPPDFPEWTEVRVRNEAWLTKWEPQRNPNFPDPTRDERAFASRCSARDREREAGLAYPFGLFVDDHLAGEVNLNHVIRAAMQSATLGYWIDERHAGNGYVAEALVTIFGFAFDELGLHRLEICIVPRNHNSLRVMEKLEIRAEGVAQRFLEINGTWEDHMRFGFTAEEWDERRDDLRQAWLHS